MAALSIGKREARSHLFSVWFYGIAALSLLLGAFLIKSYMGYVVETGILVASSPLYAPLYLVAILATVGTGLWAATTVAAEQERGTLAVLFWGPVDSIGYLVGKFGGLLVSYTLLVGTQSAFLVGVSLLTAFPLPAGFAWILLLLWGSGAAAIALGLLLSCLCRRTRSAVFLYLTCILFWTSLGLLPSFLSVVSAAASVKEWLLAVSAAADWLSPFGPLGRGTGGLVAGEPGILAVNLAFTILYVGALLILAETCLNRRGVRRP